jgi:hypothetical protein
MRIGFAKLTNSGWPVLRVRMSGDELKDFLQDSLLQVASTIGHVNDLQQLLELLVGDKSYCRWPGTNGAIRAAQIVAVGGQVGLQADAIRALLEPRLPLIAAGLLKSSEYRTNPKLYVDRILDDWHCVQ